MGHASDQEMLDVAEQVTIGHGLPGSSPVDLRTDSTATHQEAPVEVVMAELPTEDSTSTWTIGDKMSFTTFIKNLRVILANHQDREDICDRHKDPNLSGSRKHPLLPKPRTEQPVRWIHIKLLVVEGEESSSSATLLMRDDNMDVIGFINQSGVCYDFADPKRSAGRMLPQEYKSVLLGWGNSYKSILGVRKEDEVMDRLMSGNLGKTFAMRAVRLLSRFSQDGVADVFNHKLALVGLMFMVSESAKMNPVHNAIASGWDTGTGFTKQLMTDYVSKYVEMSRRLRHWKIRDYAERRPDSELHGIYLVLNVHAELVYTIGDEISFISFMTDLRRKLAEHPDREDILGGHKDPNLSKTGDHPVLAKQRADEQPARWIHVTLEAVEGEETSRTTLFMRDDNLYVLGFMNQQGDSFQLLDNNRNASTNILLPITNGCDDRPELLDWGVSYRSMMGAQSSDHAVHILEAAHLGRDFAEKAVRVLSSYPDQVAGIVLCPRVALAGLIVIVCESARMNPPHDSFARGWSTGMGFAKQLMKDYAWNHGHMSRNLMKWRNGGYDNIVTEHNYQPHPITELQTVHLVLRTHTPVQAKQEENKKSQHSKPDNAGNDGDYFSNKRSNNRGGGRPPRQSRGGRNAGGGGHGRKRGYNNGTNGGPQREHKKACNVGSSGSPASKSEEDSGGEGEGKSEEVRDADSGGGHASQPDHAGDDDIGSSSGGSASQLGEAGDTRSSGGSASASQPGGAGDNSPSRGSSGSQPREVDVPCQGNGRPLVELLAIRADLRVNGTKIIVFDGRRGQIIYRKEELGQGEQGMVDLVLTGPYKGISAYGCFAIKIDTPAAAAAAPGGRSGDAGGTLEWEWDCYETKYAAQVDEPPVCHTIRTPDGCREVAEITYAVMSNALEATVEVKLRLQDGQSPGGVCGEITAYVGDFEDGSVLFRRTQGTRQLCSPSPNDDWWCLDLARNLVAVPCGKLLQVEVDLQLESSNIHLNGTLEFNNGVSSPPSLNVNGNEVKVNITWYPEMARPSHTSEEKIISVPTELSGPSEIKMMYGHHVPDLVYTIGDEVSFARFISALRRLLAEHPDQEDILEHPVLAKQRAEQPARWLHVKLQAQESYKMSSTTLLMRDDNLYVLGFINECGVLYRLLDDNKDSVSILPEGYHPTTDIHLGVSYRSLLQAQSRNEIVMKLRPAELGGDFAMNAVRVLSSHPNKVADVSTSVRVALAGLIVIICESARMTSLRDSFADGWKDGTGFQGGLMERCVWKYVEMSGMLQEWKSRGYDKPHRINELQATYLVLRTRLLPAERTKGYVRRNDIMTFAGKTMTKGRGRPQVELLSIRADFGAVGTKIVVFDGKRGQVIYRKREQGEQGLVDLALNGPYKGISASGCFSIKVDIPAASCIDADRLIKWEWDCCDPECADEFDKPPVRRTIGFSGPGCNSIDVTYAVMSEALEATVQVKIHLRDGHSPSGVGGSVRARVDGFEVGSVLFSHNAQGTGRCFSHNDADSWFLLHLARNVVMVPCGSVLHIEVDLRVETCNNQGTKHLKADLYLANGILRQSHIVDGHEVEVNVIWYPKITDMHDDKIHEVVYTIGNDEKSYIGFIVALRRILADHRDREDILQYHYDSNLSSTRQHPLLAKNSLNKLLHIKLHVAGKETSAIVLSMEVDDLGFRRFKDTNEGYFSEATTGGRGYDSALDVRTWEDVVDVLDSARLGKAFAEDAVRVLSRFSTGRRRPVFDREVRLAVVGLSVMLSDSARFNPVLEAIAGGWNNGTGFTKQLMDYIRKWNRISTALLDWRDSSYRTWENDEVLEGIGIKTPEDALGVIHLCSPVPMDRSYLSRMNLGGNV